MISAVTWDQFLRSGMCQLELVPVADKYDCAGIEFRPYWRSPLEELPGVQEFLAEYNLVCTYACNEYLLAATEDAVRRSLLALENSLAMAGRLGAGLMRVNVAAGPFDRSLPAAGWWQRAVKQILAQAAALGVVLAVENPPNAVGGNPRFLCDLVASFASPWLKVTFDTGNWLPAGWDPFEALAILAGHIGYVHLKDMIARPDGFVPAYPGGGDMDLRGLIDRFGRMGYDGFYALEFPGGRSPAAAVKASLRHLRRETA